MSEQLTPAEPNVLTGHTELINSTNIERIVTGRNTALAKIEALIKQLDEISMLTGNLGGGRANEWGVW